MKVFMDTEFTGLHQQTTLVSIGLVSETGRTFYAELTDYDTEQVDSWLRNNVMSKLRFTHKHDGFMDVDYKTGATVMKGCKKDVAKAIHRWFNNFCENYIYIWSDCLAYDWVLFCDLWDGAFNVPRVVSYIPFDICTLFQMKGINPDIGREYFAGLTEDDTDVHKHNALWDAEVIRKCYYKLMADTES